MIQHVVERVRAIGFPVVLAVPYGEAKTFAPFCDTFAPYVPDRDVLARFAAVMEYFPDVTTVLRATGDCPLFEPLIAARVLALYRSDPQCQYASNISLGYVDGTDVEIFSAKTLLEAHLHATDPHDREHVCPFIRRHAKCLTLQADSPEEKPKISVDTPADLEFVRKVMEARCQPVI